jgi:hypothetical protein
MAFLESAWRIPFGFLKTSLKLLKNSSKSCSFFPIFKWASGTSGKFKNLLAFSKM